MTILAYFSMHETSSFNSKNSKQIQNQTRKLCRVSCALNNAVKMKLVKYKIASLSKNSFIMDVLFNGLGISAKTELESLCCMTGKTMSLFGC